MIVTPAPSNLILPPSRVPRSKGVHVSSIIRCIATEMGLLKAEFVEELSLVDVREIRDPVALLRIAIGLSWEDFYIREVLSITEDVVDHPGEMKVDGIYMTHDGESVDVIITPQGEAHSLRIHEIKATYKSTRTVGLLKEQWMWCTQMKAYCKGANTTRARLHVLFICGDYKMPITPQLKCFDVEFTQEEIDETWDLLSSYKEYKEGLNG